MSKIRSEDTDIERIVRSELYKKGYRYRKHSKDIPGKPDIVFRKQKVAVFIDGDFWHGYRYPSWRHKLSEYWQNKIEKNIRRDKKNFAKLRRNGWVVIRVWEHDIKKNLDKVIERIINIISTRSL